ncbi:putative fatty acyl-CoA reductase CG5065 isoform X3 [Bacillus rossius redtenbacheri]|uniref:putative fatty acyl-CoA reductase CG5065 isoform X3 n=1 Tax=Bacillus rossius redtenbacheri TaxID=93214 RepID=UPI002FDE5E92
MSAAGDTEVQGLYRDCGVLVTGATGFLGKLTIEKILRSCPGVRTVYALVRPKRGISVDQRKKIVLDNVVFDRMKRERPDSVDKIVFVAGDCSSPRLGLSDSDYHHLTQHVNIVLHLAATVRFDEHLKVAVDTNVKGTMEVIALCHDCVSLKAAVFVSTAYSNCPQDVIKEEFYEPPMSVEETLAMLNKFTEHELAILSPKLIEPWPNTYVFSKAIAENVVLTQRKDLPVAIVRPSMVISTLKEPIMGWVDNMYGPIAIAIGVGLGMVRVIYSSEEVIMDIIPADMVTNCVIVSALATNTGQRLNEQTF